MYRPLEMKLCFACDLLNYMEYNCVWAIGDEIVICSSEIIWVLVDPYC